MCLSSVYQKKDGENLFLCRNIAKVIPDKTGVTVFDLMGQKTVIPGQILEIDLLENTIIIGEEPA
ncbi:MAG: CooT family nickel-binding protein [Clostridia bacterium]|nr:CooT family nickel-binding protein [Clostridia bacterium]MBQ9553305.1 CooT family nickel-binding protein [Clostridia bacterium]